MPRIGLAPGGALRPPRTEAARRPIPLRRAGDFGFLRDPMRRLA